MDTLIKALNLLNKQALLTFLMYAKKGRESAFTHIWGHQYGRKREKDYSG